MKTDEIRAKFLAYYQSLDHEVVPSSSLVPENDPSLLFTNAGMVQFKDVFLGEQSLDFVRATSSQCCLRAGGKHNDLDNVGYTARHHTFFEMLGSFSFGDYFKRDAIEMAWRFLTEELGLPTDRLWVTVYEEDAESEAIWLQEIKVDKNRFSRCGADDNFWSMGDTGPCGPCTEIFYDHGEDIAGGPPGSAHADSDRYVEIWNLVFMEYNRDKSGKMTALPKPSVDTGMGLERIAAVMQGQHSNYGIDIFQILIDQAAQLLSCDDKGHHALQVIADHIRSSCFLIKDGVEPSNEGRGYVLRRIIRRALRHGYQLNGRVDFLHLMVPALLVSMGDAYPALKEAQARMVEVLMQEEQQFAKTLANGMHLLEREMAAAKDGIISGKVAFLLYDTYGFPVDLTQDIAKEKSLVVDMKGFDDEMMVQRERSQGASRFDVDYTASLADLGVSDFVGYEAMSTDSVVSAIVAGEERVSQLDLGQEGVVVLAKTPFYPQGGGQVGDKGQITWDGGVLEIDDTRRYGDAICHFGRLVKGSLVQGQEVNAVVDECRRETRYHHTATHLLHAALRQVLGEKVEQKGSLVAPDRLRFDFSWGKPLTREQVVDIETVVNRVIQANVVVDTEVMPLARAKQLGAIALFGEKYSDEVRVLSMGGFSVELCGGTHVGMTGELGMFKIIAEEGIAQGVRRIEALAGLQALSWVSARASMLSDIAALLKCPVMEASQRVERLISDHHSLNKRVAVMEKETSAQGCGDLYDLAEVVAGVKVIIADLGTMSVAGLRESVDRLRNRDEDLLAVLSVKQGAKLSLVIGVSDSLTDRIHAGDLMRHIADNYGGKGGGRVDLAQGGGVPCDQFTQVKEGVMLWLTSALERSS